MLLKIISLNIVIKSFNLSNQKEIKVFVMTYIFTIPKCYIDFTLPKNTQCFKVVVDPGI